MKHHYIFYLLFGCTIFTHILGSIIQTQDEEEKIQDRKKSLILIKENTDYVLPICVYPGIENSLIYATPDSKNAVGFCPSEEKLIGKYENCLVPNEIDSCKSSAEPFIMPDFGENKEQLSCALGRGKLYIYGFQACNYSAKNPTNDAGELNLLNPTIMYKFCYDHKNAQVLYISRILNSPKLLEDPLLDENRKTVYIPEADDFGLFENHFENIKSSFSEENLITSGQVMQYIVPPEDMVFQIWKRSVYHYINTKLVLKKTAKLLDHINTQIRQKAIDKLGEIIIVDGFQAKDSSEVHIWWKIVYSEIKYSAISIIIHNTENPPSQEEKICVKNICDENWKSLIPNDMVSHAYCCHSEDITKNNELPIAKMILNPDVWWRKIFKSQHHFLRWFC